MVAWVAVAAWLPVLVASDKLVQYTAVMHTYWTRDRFPKHYPDWSPSAQFSQLVGGSHDKSVHLFRVGETVSPTVRELAETGRWSGWHQAGPPVLDAFSGQPVSSGQGRSEVQFFMDTNHTLVSLMSRVIPSPDWFVGLDSFQLCVDGNWLDTITIEVDPLDAGTDNGFTFTAAKWATEPQGVVYRITSRYPAHPAGSFYYPYLKRLPPIATFQFIKIKEYEVSEVVNHGEDEKRYEVVKSDQRNSISVMQGNEDIQEEIAEETKEQEMLLQLGRATSTYNLWPTTQSPDQFPAGTQPATQLNTLSASHNSRNKLRKIRRDCKVSEWSGWGECSAGCGVGQMSRMRSVVKPARRFGAACPPLRQTRWCAAPDCPKPS